MQDVMPVAEYVAQNQILFNAQPEIYGSFPEKLAEILVRYESAKTLPRKTGPWLAI